MTLGFAVSKLGRLLLKLWAIDTDSSSQSRSADRFARAAVRPLYARDGIGVSVAGRPACERD